MGLEAPRRWQRHADLRRQTDQGRPAWLVPRWVGVARCRRWGLYLLAGMTGVPWFARHGSGVHAPSLGYVIGFVLAGSVVGMLAARGGDRTPVRTVLTMVLGTLLIYAVGAPYLMADLHLNAAAAWRAGVRPFLLGDALKVLLAAGLLPGVWRVTGRGRGTRAAR